MWRQVEELVEEVHTEQIAAEGMVVRRAVVEEAVQAILVPDIQ